MLVTALPLASLDAGRVVIQGLLLHKLRRTHPELFDGSAAAASVAACVADYRAQANVASVS
jgi:hypothetical protein